MSLLHRIVWINDIVVPIFAILSNILLLWLIKSVKTKNSLHIKYSLIPNSILDITVAFVIFFVAPHVFQIDGNILIIFGDILGTCDITVAGHLASIFAGLVVTSMISITVSFYIRYLVICKCENYLYKNKLDVKIFRDRKLSIQIMIFPYLILFLIFITVYLIFLWFYFSSLNYTKKLQQFSIIDFWEAEFGIMPLYIVNEILSPQFLCYCGYLFFLFTFAYSLIFYYSIQISQTLKSHVGNNNTATKLMHKQIQRTLFLQAIGPSLIGSVPLLLIFAKSLIKFESDEMSLLLSMFFPWVSITNPIAAFIFIKPYKTRIKSIFKSAASKSFQHYYGGITTKIFHSTK